MSSTRSPGMIRRGIRAATCGTIVQRSVVTAIVVGTALIAINHGRDLLQPGVLQHEWPRVLLTYLVPYLVSTWASVQVVLAPPAGHQVGDTTSRQVE